MYCFLIQGLENSWSIHKNCAEMLHEGLEKLGLDLLVKDKVNCCDCSAEHRATQKIPNFGLLRNAIFTVHA